MFSARRRIPTNRYYNKANLEKLCDDLQEAGFRQITVKLPHNLVGIEKNEIELREFLIRERNYPSTILNAVNLERSETIKILFVNISRKAFFVDDTFPSGHSEPSEIFVQSPDPARLYALSGYFGDYFRTIGIRRGSPWSLMLYLTALVFLMAQILSVINGNGFLSSVSPTLRYGTFVDIILSVLALYIIFANYSTPTGLYINPLPKRNLWNLVNQAAKGQVMDNPLVSFVVTVIAGVMTALVLKLLGLL